VGSNLPPLKRKQKLYEPQLKSIKNFALKLTYIGQQANNRHGGIFGNERVGKSLIVNVYLEDGVFDIGPI